MTSAGELSVKGLSKSFDSRSGTNLILDAIDLSVKGNEFVAIVGASGCGKTTFVRCVGGLVPPDQGSIIIDGVLVEGPGPERGFVFQHDSLFPWRNVIDNVLFGLEMRATLNKETRKLGQDLLALVGLTGFESHYPHELSGGMRQRVNLARALAIDPQILLMDEPFAALDAQTREIMQRELLTIYMERRKTVLFITHQIDEAIYLADRVLVFGARPGYIKADIAIPFERPRSLKLKRSPEFLQIVDQIWGLIEEDVVRVISQNAA